MTPTVSFMSGVAVRQVFLVVRPISPDTSLLRRPLKVVTPRMRVYTGATSQATTVHDFSTLTNFVVL